MIAIPFNFQCESVSVKTSSYTIPAGKFAYVAANALNGGTFTIDAATALNSATYDVIPVSLAGINLGATTTLYTVPVDYTFEGYIKYTTTVGNFDLDIGGADAGVTDGSRSAIIVGGGDSIVLTEVTGGSIADYSLIGMAFKSQATSSSQAFWLPSGTVINGTGNWYATVSIYSELS